MVKSLILSAIFMALTVLPAFASEVHWSYKGDTGPEYWGCLNEEFGKAIGSAQSPIDVQMGRVEQTGGAKLGIHYVDGAFSVLNNGHTIQMAPEVKNESYITLDGEKHYLQQFHFHVPSEHHINGVTLPMELHFVNKSDAGKLAVVALLFKEGGSYSNSKGDGSNKILAPAWENMPTERNATARIAKFAITKLLPAKLTNIQYSGSLTTPPTAEGVSWIILDERAYAADAQFKKFNTVIGDNARPVQPLNDRRLYLSSGVRQ
ncbi:carbonic anhydrase [Synergistales bacterium]|nr:carbonic anhydrase [Synergistales bacterium]